VSAKVDLLALEASRVYRFIDLVGRFVREQCANHAYPVGSLPFLDYVIDLADTSKKYLQEGILDDPNETREDRLRKISQLLEGWTKLHAFVKPVADANTLRLPLSFISFSAQHLSKLPNLGGARIAVELIAQMNYLQRPHTPLRAIAEGLALKMQEFRPPELPKVFGIVGLPYSQGSDFFVNCALYHELGHFVYEQRRLRGSIWATLVPLLMSTFRNLQPTISQPVLYERCKAHAKFVSPWCEEIFCDLFATRMLGPVYTFVFAHLLELISGEVDESQHHYSPTHPSAVLRLTEQISLLKKLGWWRVLHDSHDKWLEQIERPTRKRAPRRIYASSYAAAKLSPRYVKKVFLPALPAIRQLADETTDGHGIVPARFPELAGKINACLEHGIVPSVVFSVGRRRDENVITLINAAYLFYLSHTSALFKIIVGLAERRVSDQARVRHRIEEWTMKAIEYLVFGGGGVVR
jgi:hypothetical protein